MENYIHNFCDCFVLFCFIFLYALLIANVCNFPLSNTHTHNHSFISDGTWTSFAASDFTPKMNWTYFLFACSCVSAAFNWTLIESHLGEHKISARECFFVSGGANGQLISSIFTRIQTVRNHATIENLIFAFVVNDEIYILTWQTKTKQWEIPSAVHDLHKKTTWELLSIIFFRYSPEISFVSLSSVAVAAFIWVIITLRPVLLPFCLCSLFLIV